MMMFEKEYTKFWEEFGESKKMVLSTSFNDIVTSRMMSIIAIREKLYFQTDSTSRKYDQLKGNSNVALCIDNIQMEGESVEVGHPLDNIEFCNAYKTCFPSSYERYTSLKNERLFAISPTFIERWIYKEGIPYIEKFDVNGRNYVIQQYCGACR